MQKPDVYLELGSGSGSCSLMVGLAMKENNKGIVISSDNGEQWSSLKKINNITPYLNCDSDDYFTFLKGLSKRFGLGEQISYINKDFPDFPTSNSPINILFADYESQPSAIVQILKYYFPKMSNNFSIFIDGVSSYLPSFLFLERMVEQINSGKIPAFLISDNCDETYKWWAKFVLTHKLTLVHLTEDIKRKQNSTVWLIGEPVDFRPYPKVDMY